MVGSGVKLATHAWCDTDMCEGKKGFERGLDRWNMELEPFLRLFECVQVGLSGLAIVLAGSFSFII